MRPPGGPPTRGTVLPTSTAVEENGGKQGLVEVRSSLRELTVLLEPQSDHEASARREEPPDETADEAIAQANLGLLYAQRAEGDRSQNWESAIAAFEDALSALTRESNPEEWAAAQMHLGVAYRDRLAGDRSENQERAIRAFENCLLVWIRKRYPEQWAAARMNLGIACWERLAGDPSENHERAIGGFEDSLSVWKAKDHPEDWATVQMNLGIAYRERRAGNRWENQERAIGAFAGALSVWSRERHPEHWAAARMNLGILYWQRVAGHRSENREQAIVALEDALSVWTRETNPEGWAAACMNIGIAYRESAAGERSESRDRAITAFENALSVWTREANPKEWAAARMHLGGAYLEHSGGDRSENLEWAIAAFEDALSVLTREANPEEWAAAHMKLGTAYRERLAGDGSENRKRAIVAFENALLVWTRERNPTEVTAARANLEAAYQDRFGDWMESRVTIGPVAAQDIRVVGLVSSAHFMSHFYQIVLPPLFPLLKGAFGVGYAELSIVMSLMYATSGLMQTPAGVIVDRLGPARVLIGGLGVYSVAVLLYGFAPNLWALAALAVVAGLGNCVFHPADYAILSARVGAARLGRAYGTHNLGGSLGWAAAPVAVLSLTALVGWRVGLAILGGLGLLLTLYLVVQAGALATEGRVQRGSKPAVNPAKMFLAKPILVCFGYFILLAVATVAQQAFLPSSLISRFGVSFEVANSALTGFLVGSALGMFAGGIIADRFGRHEIVVATGLLTAALVSLALGLLAVPVAALLLCVAVGGFAWGCTTPSRDLLVRSAAPAGAMGTVVGFVYSGLDLGSAMTPPFLGFLLDHHHPRLIFIFTAGILLLAICTAFMVGRNDTRRARTAPVARHLRLRRTKPNYARA
jgi:FSR family fosmidomycin resistance protein-like MFS transporter